MPRAFLGGYIDALIKIGFFWAGLYEKAKMMGRLDQGEIATNTDTAWTPCRSAFPGDTAEAAYQEKASVPTQSLAMDRRLFLYRRETVSS